MMDDILDATGQARLVAKDILAATEIANHPNILYIPSKQLCNILSDEQIAKTIMYLSEKGALGIDRRSMYVGGHIEVHGAYQIYTNGFSLRSMVNPPEVIRQPNTFYSSAATAFTDNTRKGSAMTGKEKLQIVVNEINEAHQALITGNVIEIDSDELLSAGLSINEQKQALDVLANDRKCIRYSLELKQVINPDDVTPLTGLWVMQTAAMNSESTDTTIKRLLESYIYTVEVLEGFATMVSTNNQALRPETTPVAKSVHGVGASDNKQPNEAEVSKIAVHKFRPSHYSSRKGILQISSSPEHDVKIAKNGKVKKPNGQKYEQCWFMECLFKNVNSLKSGVDFSRLVSVKKEKIGKKEAKKIRNTVAEINKKITDKGGPKNLIKIQNQKMFLNSSYLE